MRRIILLLTLALPAAAQPHELGERVLAPQRGDRTTLLGASSDSGHLLVWLDARRGRNSSADQPFAARVRTDGEVLDPAGIALNLEARFGVLASDGTDFLLLAGPFGRTRVDAVRITGDGTVIPLPPFDLTRYPLALAWNGSDYGLLYDSGSGLRLALLDRDGRVRSGSIAFPRCFDVPRLAATRDQWLVTAGQCRALVASKDFPAPGTTRDVAFPAYPNSWVVAAAGDGAGFLTVEWEGDSSYVIQSIDGITRISVPNLDRERITIARDGDTVLLTDGRTAVRVSGQQARTFTPPGATVKEGLRLLPSRSGVLAAWIDGRFPGAPQIAAAVVDSAEWRAGGTIVSQDLWQQEMPNIARGGDTIIAAWTEHSALPARVAVQRLAPDSRPLAPPRYVADAGAYGRPVVAFDGSAFLILWAHGPSAFRGIRMAPDGTLLGEELHIEDEHFWNGPSSLTWDGSNWMFATPSAIYRLRPDGSVAERRPFLNYDISGTQARPFGNEWLGLAFEDHYPPVGSVPTGREWWLVRLHPSLAYPTETIPIGFGFLGSGNASVAWNGDRGLVVWWAAYEERWMGLPIGTDPFAHRLYADGEARPLPYGSTSGDAQVEVTESGFLVAAGDVIALHRLDGTLLTLHRLPRSAREPRLLPLGEREALAVFPTDADGDRITRIFAERVTLSPKRRSAP